MYVYIDPCGVCVKHTTYHSASLSLFLSLTLHIRSQTAPYQILPQAFQLPLGLLTDTVTECFLFIIKEVGEGKRQHTYRHVYTHTHTHTHKNMAPIHLLSHNNRSPSTTGGGVRTSPSGGGW
jgi:hypothetical protein